MLTCAAASELLITIRQLIIQAKLREVADLDPLGTKENATFGRAREVLCAIYAPIVLAGRLVERHSHPGAHAARDFGHLANESHDATAVVS